jgi:pimeloyl-ACP methyl ester carboxylesterase
MQRRAANPTREEAIAAGVDILSLISYPDPARDPNAFRRMAADAFDRGYNPRGTRRQLLAILADGSRVERLAAIRAPTLLIHGSDDPLVPAANSEDLARAIPHARLVTLPAMAHDFPPSKVPEMVRLVTEHLARG